MTAGAVGQNIAARRRACGFRQDVLAERLKVTQATVSRWESGRREIRVSELLAVAAVLECSAGTLLTGVEARPGTYGDGFEDGWRAAGNAMHAALVKGPDAGPPDLGGGA